MRLLLTLALMPAFASAQTAPQLTIPPVAVSSAWASVPLPEMPLGIVAHDGAFWVCGANEMIAESSDGGEHWSLRHWSPQGAEMLFTMAFVGNTIQAYGTAGTHLVSSDGGATWAAQAFDQREAILDVRFGDAMHAYAATARGYATSDDGGKGWKFEDVHQASARIAVLDGEHAAVVYRKPEQPTGKPDTVLRTTADGGHHWQEAEAPGGFVWTGIRPSPGGFELSGEKDGSPAAAYYFSYATGWKPGAASPAQWSCTEQGCLIPDGWEDSSGTELRMWAMPTDADSPIHDAWAAAGESFCAIADLVRCRRGRTAWRGPGRQEDAAAGAITPAKCLRCPAPGYPAVDRKAGRQGEVEMHVWIGTDGHIRYLDLLSTASAAMATVAMNAVRSWVYSPALQGGKPRQIDTRITMSFFLRN